MFRYFLPNLSVCCNEVCRFKYSTTGELVGDGLVRGGGGALGPEGAVVRLTVTQI
jgi:hypothetical protein